eukprot:Rhum_TRINITY_DN14433_c14_g1::Rhum_TRINITY_DN14433_c14_g1_i1::g.91275::m.91275
MAGCLKVWAEGCWCCFGTGGEAHDEPPLVCVVGRTSTPAYDDDCQPSLSQRSLSTCCVWGSIETWGTACWRCEVWWCIAMGAAGAAEEGATGIGGSTSPAPKEMLAYEAAEAEKEGGRTTDSDCSENFFDTRASFAFVTSGASNRMFFAAACRGAAAAAAAAAAAGATGAATGASTTFGFSCTFGASTTGSAAGGAGHSSAAGSSTFASTTGSGVGAAGSTGAAGASGSSTTGATSATGSGSGSATFSSTFGAGAGFFGAGFGTSFVERARSAHEPTAPTGLLSVTAPVAKYTTLFVSFFSTSSFTASSFLGARSPRSPLRSPLPPFFPPFPPFLPVSGRSLSPPFREGLFATMLTPTVGGSG